MRREPSSQNGRARRLVPASSDAGQVQSVSRALAILKAFSGEETFLSLAELGRRTGMHKPTVLRLARTLSGDGFLVQRAQDGAWRLGPSAGAIGARYQAQFDANAIIETHLRELSAQTGESSSFYIYENDVRSCLVRCDGPRGILQHVRQGELLPLERGSAGRVMLAALGTPGAIYDRIRRQGYCVTRGERSKGAASISVVVLGVARSVLGSVCVSGPIERLSRQQLHAHASVTMRAAAQISWKLGAVSMDDLRSTWHP